MELSRKTECYSSHMIFYREYSKRLIKKKKKNKGLSEKPEYFKEYFVTDNRRRVNLALNWLLFSSFLGHRCCFKGGPSDLGTKILQTTKKSSLYSQNL